MKIEFEEGTNCVLLDSFAEVLAVEVYLEDISYISKEELLESVEKYCGSVELNDRDDNTIIFLFEGYEVDNEKIKIGISIRDGSPSYDKLEKAYKQSWMFPISKRKIQRCSAILSIAEINVQGLRYYDRLNLFQRFTYSILKCIKPTAIYWPLTQQIVDGDIYLKNNPISKYYDILMGAFNIRIFKIADQRNELLVDTLGLGALGLVDMQCRCRNLDPQVIAGVLYSYAYYMYENGDVIEDGSIIRGITPGNKWTCERRVSTLEPKRTVLDIVEFNLE